jgi:hypothetical protein
MRYGIITTSKDTRVCLYSAAGAASIAVAMATVPHEYNGLK